jgi:hypothetical protein
MSHVAKKMDDFGILNDHKGIKAEHLCDLNPSTLQKKALPFVVKKTAHIPA